MPKLSVSCNFLFTLKLYAENIYPYGICVLKLSLRTHSVCWICHNELILCAETFNDLSLYSCVKTISTHRICVLNLTKWMYTLNLGAEPFSANWIWELNLSLHTESGCWTFLYMLNLDAELFSTHWICVLNLTIRSHWIRVLILSLHTESGCWTLNLWTKNSQSTQFVRINSL